MGSEDLPGSSGRIQVLEKELLISVSDVQDNGKYVCNATNSKGIAHATAYVKVLIRTRITNPPQSASVIKGSNHMIQCKAVVDPTIIAIWSWWQGNQQIQPGDTRRQILPDGSLLLKAVRNEDIGNYTCKVTSQAGNDEGSATLKVIGRQIYPLLYDLIHLTKSSGSLCFASLCTLHKADIYMYDTCF